MLAPDLTACPSLARQHCCKTLSTSSIKICFPYIVAGGDGGDGGDGGGGSLHLHRKEQISLSLFFRLTCVVSATGGINPPKEQAL